MIKKIAWDTFKNTGDINTFLELKQIENIEKGIENNFSELQNGEEKTQEISNKQINNKFD